MTRPLVILDLDNTVYNWVDFFAPSFRAMIHALSKETGVEEMVIINQFKTIYANKESVEYSFTVQELDLCKKLPLAEVDRLIRIARGAFSRARKKHLKPYAGVKETLRWATKHNIQIVALTNSPLFHAARRLYQLRLDLYIKGLAAWDNNDLDIMELKKRISIKEKHASKVTQVWELSQSELKPSPIGYQRIMRDLNATPEQTYVVGDSLSKDIAPALQLGVVGIWASYGQTYEPKNFETILQITHWDAKKIAAIYDEKSISPTHTINAFDDLMSIIPPLQPNLF